MQAIIVNNNRQYTIKPLTRHQLLGLGYRPTHHALYASVETTAGGAGALNE
jgi:hypothetical protein